MDRFDADVVVIGAGAVGLAVARELAQAGREVWVLEASSAIGQGVSSRSSEVMHAGLYYPSGSLKAQFCVRGRALLQLFCVAHGIAHRQVGKLVVATSPSQHGALEALGAQARANGVDDLQTWTAEQAQRAEPALRVTAALWSPSTGIFDSHAYMQALWAQAQAAGATLVLRAPVRSVEAGLGNGRLEVCVGGAEPAVVCTQAVINAGGLSAPWIAARTMPLLPGLPHARCCKGHYFTVPGRSAFSRLIYPMPNEAGLGVHLTLDLSGGMRFGPDTEWIDPPAPGTEGDPVWDVSPWYAVDERRAAAFATEIRRYWPGLPEGALQPAYAGIRPKISGPGEAAADFRVEGPAQHGVDGLIHLLGIESPGLTASLAIAEHVRGLLP